MSEPVLFVRDTGAYPGDYFVIAGRYDYEKVGLKEVDLYPSANTGGNPAYRAEVHKTPTGAFVAVWRKVDAGQGPDKEYYASVTYTEGGTEKKSKAVKIKVEGLLRAGTSISYPSPNSNISASAFVAYGTVDPPDTALDFTTAQRTRLRRQDTATDAPVSSSSVIGSDWWVLWESLAVDKVYDLRVKNYGLSAQLANNLTAQ